MKKINFWKNKKVLVTGHTGFKGGWLSLWLYILGAKIAGYALNPKTKKNFFNILNLKKIFTIDVRKNIQSISEIKKLIKKFKSDFKSINGFWHSIDNQKDLEFFKKDKNKFIYRNATQLKKYLSK